MGDGPGIQAGEEPEEEKPMNPHLLEFFDAMDVRDYDKMLEALARLSQKAGRRKWTISVWSWISAPRGIRRQSRSPGSASMCGC